MLKEEIWVPIAGFENHYHVSNYGHVKSLSRIRQDGRRIKERIRKLCPDKDGYLRVGLVLNGRVYTYFVHFLVLQAFVGPRPYKFEACHNNGISGDCRLDNLRWDTRKNNHADKKIHGTSVIGARNGRAKRTEDEIRELYRLRNSGLKYKEIETKTGIPWGSIWNIIHGASWKHIHSEFR